MDYAFVLIVAPVAFLLFFMVVVGGVIGRLSSKTVYDNRQYHVTYNVTNNYNPSVKEIEEAIYRALDQGAQFKMFRDGTVKALYPGGKEQILEPDEVRVLVDMENAGG